MDQKPITQNRFVSIARAHSLNESIRLRLLLDRTRIPYRIRNEQILEVYPMALTSAFGAMEFEVPAEMFQEAQAALDEIFEIDLANLPEFCPACDFPTASPKLECPSCGLFLG